MENSKMVYVVTISYNRYVFESAEDAFGFAEMAKSHYRKWRSHEDKTVDVEVSVIFEDELKKVEEEE